MAPVDENTLLLYVSFLHCQKLKASSIFVYLSAVRSYHVMNGFSNPLEGCHRLDLAMKSIERSDQPPKGKLPITMEIMSKLSKVIRYKHAYQDSMVWAAMNLAFFGFLRASEFTVSSPGNFDSNVHLCVGHISFHSVQKLPYVKICIKASKTDVKQNGFQLVLGCSGTEVCAYCSILLFYGFRSTADNFVTHAPFFYLDHKPLTRSGFVVQVRNFLSKIQIQSSLYTGHSFRVGGATTAAAAGLADWEIKMLGRWSSDSYQRYIKAPLPLLVNFAKRICHKTCLSEIHSFRNPYILNLIQ